MYQTLVFLTSAFVTLFATPSLIKVAYLKRLFDMPDFERKTHNRAIPTIGGIIIFAASLFAYALWYPETTIKEFKYLVVAMLILFFVGIKDDIIGTAPVKKLMAQILVALILILMGGIKITGLHGLFGVQQIPDWASVFLSLFTIIVIINSINLIDGIDGLAAGVGLIASFTFGSWFYLAGDGSMATLAFALCGSLTGYLFFNFSPAKIFMGDSGSLTIGLVLSVLAIKMVEQDVSSLPEYLVNVSRPLLAIAALVYPLYDTLRVFIYRALKGRSPFSADKKHIHHRLLKVGLNHAYTSVILYAASFSVIALTVLLSDFDSTIVFVIVGAFTILIAQIPFFLREKEELASI